MATSEEESFVSGEYLPEHNSQIPNTDMEINIKKRVTFADSKISISG